MNPTARAACLAIAGTLVACSDADEAGSSERDAAPPTLTFTSMTFNTGISRLPGEPGKISDQWYGNGVAVPAIIDATRTYLSGLDLDVLGFQEIFHTDDCAEIPPEYHAGFVCETHRPGDPTVARTLLGDDWQVVCHLGKNDECLAVHRDFGRFRGCESDFCLDALDGVAVEGCGRGSRVGRGVIELVGGGELTVVNFHGTAGATSEDSECRARQVAQIFVDFGLGDGPAANGERNLVLGDFNTDPGRFTDEDSAIVWNEHVGDGKRFHFLSDVGPDAAPSYSGLFNIDHQVSDAFEGACVIPGVTDGYPPVTELPSYDHKPVICEITGPRSP